MVVICKNLNPLHQRCFVPSLVEIGPAALEKIFQFVNVYFLFCYYLPIGKGIDSSLNKHESPSLKDDLCQVWSKLWFLVSSIYFCFFVIISS